MTNTAQFSAAKNLSETKLMQDEVFGPNGKIKSFQRFEKDVADVVDIQQKTWLRVEYETCRRNAISGSAFSQMQESASAYPYWVYITRHDAKVRPEHAEMEGKVFEIGDRAGDECFPPGDWNCRCHGEPVDDAYLQENGKTVNRGAESIKLRDENIASNFRYNPANQGPMPNDHSYFDLFPSANSGNANLFGLDPLQGGGAHLSAFAGHSLRYIVEMVHDWRREHHVDGKHNIVIQNAATWTNVRLSDTAIHRISKHPKGMDLLPAAIENPTEIWSTWEDAKDQRVVLRNYILAGKSAYIVQTRDGIVVDAFASSLRLANKYRKGVILL